MMMRLGQLIFINIIFKHTIEDAVSFQDKSENKITDPKKIDSEKNTNQGDL